MRTSVAFAVAGSLMAAAAASATPVLQIDVNSFQAQAVNAGGAPTAFGGLTHTGALQFSIGQGHLVGAFIQSMPFGPFLNAGLAGVTLTGFSGQVNLVNGLVTGGNITLEISSGDSYTCLISPGSGAVSTYVGGGYKIEALTHGGMFSDSMFGNVDITPWYNAQGIAGLFGSLLEFNFDPDPTGAASSDMDIFVDVVPLPPAAYAGLGTLAGAVVLRRIRTRS